MSPLAVVVHGYVARSGRRYTARIVDLDGAVHADALDELKARVREVVRAKFADDPELVWWFE